MVTSGASKAEDLKAPDFAAGKMATSSRCFNKCKRSIRYLSVMLSMRCLPRRPWTLLLTVYIPFFHNKPQAGLIGITLNCRLVLEREILLL